MLREFRLAGTGRPVKQHVQAVGAVALLHVLPLRVERAHHLQDFRHVRVGIDGIEQVTRRSAFLVAARVFHIQVQQVRLRLRDGADALQRVHLAARLQQLLGARNRLRNAARRNLELRSKALQFLFRDNRACTLFAHHGLPHLFALFDIGAFETHGVVEPAQRAVLDIANVVRNPDDRNLDLFQEEVQRTLLAAVENHVGFIHQENRLLLLVLGGGIQYTPHAATHHRVFLAVAVHALGADVGEHQRALEFLRNRLREFSLAGTLDPVEENVQTLAHLRVLDHVESHFHLRILAAEFLVRHAAALVNPEVEAVQVVTRMPVQEHPDSLGNIEVLVQDAHLLEGTLVRDQVLEIHIRVKLRENIRERRPAEPAGTNHVQERTALLLVEKNPREQHDFHLGVAQVERVLHNVQAAEISVVHAAILLKNLLELAGNALVKHLLRGGVENALAAQVVAHEIGNLLDGTRPVDYIVKAHHRHLTPLVSNARLLAAFVAAEPLSGVTPVHLLHESLPGGAGDAVLFGVELLEVLREVLQHARGSLLRENRDAVIRIRHALGGAHHADPVLVTLERHEVV